MALHQVGRPEFPVFEKLAKGIRSTGICMPPQQFSSGWGRARARIKQRNIHFPLRERAIDKWQVADHRCKKSESKSSFQNDKKTRQQGSRNDIAESQREKSRAAEIEVRGETRLTSHRVHARPRSVL